MDLLNIEDRKKLIKNIESEANKNRKNSSAYQYEVYKNKLKGHVKNHLLEYLSPQSVKRMSIIHSVGMCERIIKQEASIYKDEPKREFKEITEDQKLKLDRIYSEMKYNEKCKTHNRYFKLQHQSVSMITPKNKKLVKRVLLEHQYDIIPNTEDPEEPIGFVISNLEQPKDSQDKRYVIWSKDYNFTMDGNGVILTAPDAIENAIAPTIPLTVASYEKNGEYYPDEVETCVDFTILLNAALSELYHIMRMQGFGQAVITGTKKAMPAAETIEVGVNSIIALITEEGGDKADFKFVNANPDLAGTIDVVATVLSAYLSSKGHDPKAINIRGESAQSFASGWERFLSLIEKFEATKDDLAVFKNVEEYEFDIIRAWHNVAIGSDILDKELVSTTISKNAKVATEFVRPEAIMTEPERIASIKTTETNGYISHIEGIKRAHNLESDKEAEDKYKKIQEDNAKYPGIKPPPIETEEETEEEIDA